MKPSMSSKICCHPVPLSPQGSSSARCRPPSLDHSFTSRRRLGKIKCSQGQNLMVLHHIPYRPLCPTFPPWSKAPQGSLGPAVHSEGTESPPWFGQQGVLSVLQDSVHAKPTEAAMEREPASLPCVPCWLSPRHIRLWT